MDKTRKIKCDCGDYLKEKTIIFDNIETAAMVCCKCHYKTFTIEQAKEYAKLKEIHSLVDSKRKIIRIGNSLGITLPEKLREFGLKAGKKVKLEALDRKSFKVEFI